MKKYSFVWLTLFAIALFPHISFSFFDVSRIAPDFIDGDNSPETPTTDPVLDFAEINKDAKTVLSSVLINDEVIKEEGLVLEILPEETDLVAGRAAVHGSAEFYETGWAENDFLDLNLRATKSRETEEEVLVKNDLSFTIQTDSALEFVKFFAAKTNESLGPDLEEPKTPQDRFKMNLRAELLKVAELQTLEPTVQVIANAKSVYTDFLNEESEGLQKLISEKEELLQNPDLSDEERKSIESTKASLTEQKKKVLATLYAFLEIAVHVSLEDEEFVGFKIHYKKEEQVPTHQLGLIFDFLNFQSVSIAFNTARTAEEKDNFSVETSYILSFSPDEYAGIVGFAEEWLYKFQSAQKEDPIMVGFENWLTIQIVWLKELILGDELPTSLHQ